MLTVVPSPGRRSIENSFTSRFEPLRPRPSPYRVRITVGHRQFDICNAGAVVLKDHFHSPFAIPSFKASKAHLAAASVDHRVSRQLAGRSDHLGLIDQAEAQLDGPLPHGLPDQHDIVRRTRISIRLISQGTAIAPPICRAPISSSVHPLLDVEGRADAGSDRPSSTSVMATAGLHARPPPSRHPAPATWRRCCRSSGR